MKKPTDEILKMPEPGKKAPAFKAKDQNGKIHQLKDYAGKKLVLFFYPKDLTPTCTVEVCNLRDAYALLLLQGLHLIGVSDDDECSHEKFATRHQLPFPIVSDTSYTMIRRYGVWGEKQLYGKKFMGIHRTTFIISETGKIEHVIKKVKSADHAQQILALLEGH